MRCASELPNFIGNIRYFKGKWRAAAAALPRDVPEKTIVLIENCPVAQ
jgi:hypothetical protein